MPRTVLDTVLDQLDLKPSEYFQRLSLSLEEARLERLHRASAVQETDVLIQDEVAPPGLTIMPDDELEDFTLTELGEEEPVGTPTGTAAAARARAKRPTRARTARPVAEEEEDELAEFGLEPITDDESQFRQAYRRAMRTNRRPPFRER